MSLNTSNQQPETSVLRSKIIPAITILCAIGVGITGTLLWSQSQAKPVVTSVPLSASPEISGVPPEISGNVPLNVPNNIPIDATDHTPPATLTAGMKASEAALTLGNWYYDHEQWPKAIENYRRAIASGLDNANVRTDLGNALRFIGKPREALDQYRTAQRQNPAHEQSLYNQGALWAFSLNDSKQAVTAWKMYIERFPNGQNVPDAKEFIAKHQ
jgi:tetratricopeptide (TPR) repeat protein